MPRVEVHPQADSEVDAIISWYEQKWQGLGLAFLDEVDDAIGKIVQSPLTWRSVERLPNVYRLNIHRFPYCVIYRYQQTVIEIVAVAHQHRKPGYWKQRLRDFETL